MRIFVDTSALIALVDSKDRNHREALAKRDRLKEEKHNLYTSNLVIYETLTWLAIRLGPGRAAQFGEGLLLQSPSFSILYLTREDELVSLRTLQKYSNLPLSFADSSTIHLVHKNRLDQIFAFDDHFRKANLQIF